MGSTPVHRSAMAVMLLVLAQGAHAAAACHRPVSKTLLERFIPADCERCWQAAAPRDRQADVMVLDWIVPTGDSAPMAAVALPEAARRAGAMQADDTTVRQVALTRRHAPRVQIADGPAWNGYIGLQLTVHQRGVPSGAVGYVALVERVPAGSEGSPVARQLVRSVVGPLPLDELAAQAKVSHLVSVRLPDGSRADRLGSVGWVEAPQGTVIAAVQSPPSGCAPIAR